MEISRHDVIRPTTPLLLLLLEETKYYGLRLAARSYFFNQNHFLLNRELTVEHSKEASVFRILKITFFFKI